MIGDHISRRNIKRLKLFGNLVVLGFYLLCVIQSEKWYPYSSICAPLVFTSWIWGLIHYRQPRQLGKVLNFGDLVLGSSTLGFQRGSLIDLSGGLGNLDRLPVPREALTGSQNFQYTTSTTLQFKVKKDELALEPPARVSRYKKISDPGNWIV